MMTLRELHNQTAASDPKFAAYVAELITILGEDTMVSRTAVRGASALIPAAKYAEHIRDRQGGVG